VRVMVTLSYSLVKPSWSNRRGQTVVVKLSWSNRRGQTVVVKLSWSNCRGQTVVVKLSWSNCFGQNPREGIVRVVADTATTRTVVLVVVADAVVA
jgi:hypothetical protein